MSSLALRSIQTPVQLVLIVERPEREGSTSLPSSVELKNEWNYISKPYICLHRMDSDKFYITCIYFTVKNLCGKEKAGNLFYSLLTTDFPNTVSSRVMICKPTNKVAQR
jgi:hypothetical protein